MKKSCLCLLALAFTLSSTDAMIPPKRTNKTRSGTRKIHPKKTPKSTRPAQPAAEDLHAVAIPAAAISPADSFASLPADTLTQPQQDYSPFALASDLWNAGKLSEEQKRTLERMGVNLSKALILLDTVSDIGKITSWEYIDYVLIGNNVSEITATSWDPDNYTKPSSRVACETNSSLRCILSTQRDMKDRVAQFSADNKFKVEEDEEPPLFGFRGQFEIPASIKEISMLFLYSEVRNMFFHNECKEFDIEWHNLRRVNLEEYRIQHIDYWENDIRYYCGPCTMSFGTDLHKHLEKMFGETMIGRYTSTRRYEYRYAVIAADMARACMHIDYSQHVEKYRTWGSAAVLQQKGILPPTIEKVLADHKLALSETYVMRGKSLFVDDISCEILKYPVIYIDSDVEWIGDKCFEGLDNLRTIIFGPNSQVDSIGKGAFSSCKSLEKIIFVSYPDGRCEWLEEECTKADIEQDKLEIETCKTVTEEEEDASDISKNAVREPASDSQNSSFKIHLLGDLYAAVCCQKYSTSDPNQLSEKERGYMESFLRMSNEQQKDIKELLQRIDNDEIEQLFQYYSNMRNSMPIEVVSGEHVPQFAPPRYRIARLIVAPDVKTISAKTKSNTTGYNEVYFMKGSQFEGFVEPRNQLNVKGKTVDAFTFHVLTHISLANCNKLKILPRYMFYKCPELKFVSVPDTIYEIETDCFYDCKKLQIITFGLDSRLTTLGNNHSRFVFCIGPSRFFRISHDLRLWRSIYTPWQRAPLGIEHDHDHCCFEEVCKWSPEHYIREMEANMWPQKSQTKE